MISSKKMAMDAYGSLFSTELSSMYFFTDQIEIRQQTPRKQYSKIKPDMIELKFSHKRYTYF